MAGLLFGGVVGFVGEHALFGAAAAAAFLAADLLPGGAFGGDVAGAELLDLVEQEPAGEEAVEALLTGGLALDLEASGAMEQHDAGGGLVDVLAAVAAGADEGFFDVRFAHAERGHALGELGFFVWADGECGHGGSIAVGTTKYTKYAKYGEQQMLPQRETVQRVGRMQEGVVRVACCGGRGAGSNVAG